MALKAVTKLKPMWTSKERTQEGRKYLYIRNMSVYLPGC